MGLCVLGYLFVIPATSIDAWAPGDSSFLAPPAIDPSKTHRPSPNGSIGRPPRTLPVIPLEEEASYHLPSPSLAVVDFLPTFPSPSLALPLRSPESSAPPESPPLLPNRWRGRGALTPNACCDISGCDKAVGASGDLIFRKWNPLLHPNRLRVFRVGGAAASPKPTACCDVTGGLEAVGVLRAAMSMDSVISSRSGADYRSFRQITRDRLLFEMLRSTKKSSKSAWKVLIMDKLTVKIMSFSCKMADVMEEVVEDLYMRRQPLPLMDAIYFIQPTKENIRIFMSDMSGKIPLYKNSPVQRELVAQIKKDSNVRARIGALSEMNLEYFAIDSQGFTTDHDKALEELFSENAEGSLKYNSCLNMMATRIATVFASMREFPRVHYRVARTIDASTLTTLRDLAPTKLAAGVWNCLARFKAMIPEFPQTETCELLIVDRSIDQIAPIIHEWTYDAMCHDLLCMDGNKYVQQVPSKSGSGTENKEVLLEDHDPIWLELRHASERLHEKMTNFVSKNKAAQLHQARNGGDLSTKELQKMVQALPQYSDQIDKLALHVEIAGKLNSTIKEQQLKDVGQLEQDLVFGDAGTKELINFFRTHLDISRENKLRLLMVYAAINPDKTRSDKGAKLMQLAGLSADDMIAVSNMRCLCGHDSKKSSAGGFTLKFDLRKKRHGIRKERIGEESKWMLSRFYPILEELIEKLSKGELPKDEYHCLNDPSPSFRGIPSASTQTSPAHQPAQSMRSRRTGGTWARPRDSDDGYSSDSVLKHTSSNSRKLGQRLFVFVIGGATRSELCAAHKLSSKLKREIILGSSSLDDPPQFITESMEKTSEEELVVSDSMDAAGEEVLVVTNSMDDEVREEVHVTVDYIDDEASEEGHVVVVAGEVAGEEVHVVADSMDVAAGKEVHGVADPMDDEAGEEVLVVADSMDEDEECPGTGDTNIEKRFYLFYFAKEECVAAGAGDNNDEEIEEEQDLHKQKVHC
uniref:SNARE-interacting protein KEULE n=1 Tax=Oryza nivara TaxID=4536 RepID=A0A0E0G8C8_ORYNI